MDSVDGLLGLRPFTKLFFCMYFLNLKSSILNIRTLKSCKPSAEGNSTYAQARNHAKCSFRSLSYRKVFLRSFKVEEHHIAELSLDRGECLKNETDIVFRKNVATSKKIQKVLNTISKVGVLATTLLMKVVELFQKYKKL